MNQNQPITSYSKGQLLMGDYTLSTKIFHNILLWIILLLSSYSSIGQEDFIVAKNAPLDTIPFVLTEHNNLSITATLNSEDTINLMLHTAANSMTITTAAAKTINTIQWDEEEEVESWGGNTTARYSQSNRLQIGQLSWDSIAIWENEHSGPTTDGKFGLNLFEGKIVEINFDGKIIVLHPEMPNSIDDYEKLNLVLENGFMFLEAKSLIAEKSYEHKFLIHSGYGGTILYDDEFANRSKIGQHLEIIDEKELKDSYGNVLKTKKAILPIFNISGQEFKDIPVGFFEGSIGRQSMSVIGGDLLKRFNMIIDADRAHLYIKASHLKGLPFSAV